MSASERSSSLTHLARLGFSRLARRRRCWPSSSGLRGLAREDLLAGAAVAADPDEALGALARIARRDAAPVRALHADPQGWRALWALLGASTGFADFYLRHPEELAAPRRGRRRPADAETSCDRRCSSRSAPWTASPPTAASASWVALRVRYRRLLARIAAYDLLSASPVDAVAAVAARLADAAGAALEASLCVARTRVSNGARGCRAVPARAGRRDAARRHRDGQDGRARAQLRERRRRHLRRRRGSDAGLGALGESRVVDIATRLAVQTMRGISSIEIEPPLWEVDANLRPEGKQGALVRTLDSHLSYYDRWAKSWEFQALLKARPIAGDAALGEAYVRAVQPKIWTSAARENFVDSVQRMRERVTEHIPAADVPYQLKLGPGGIRDIEFTVQLLQLVHGLSDDRIRQRGTLEALDALVDRGLHRPHRGRGVLARLPRAAPARAPRAAAEPAPDAPHALAPRGPARARARVQRTRRHRRAGLERVGVRQARGARHPCPPLLPPAPVGGGGPAGGGAVALARAGARPARRDRLRRPGRRAAAHRGAHERAEPQGDDPAAPHAGHDPVVRRRGRPRLRAARLPAAQRAARRHARGSCGCCATRPGAAESLTRVLSGSRYVGELMEWIPESAAWLDDPRAAATARRASRCRRRRARSRPATPRSTTRCARCARSAAASCCASRCRAILGTVDDRGGRARRSPPSPRSRSRRRSARCGATIVPPEDDALDFSVIAMGRFGGARTRLRIRRRRHVRLPAERRRPAARARARRCSSSPALRKHSEDHRVPLDLDADLRPEGRNGPIARSLDAYAEYYRRWSLSWEAQALLRARGVAGSVKLIRAFTELADDVRYPGIRRPAGTPRDQAHQGARRERAPAAGRRPRAAPQARSRVAQRRRVARAAAAARARPPRARHADDLDDRRAAGGRGCRARPASRRRPARRRPGGWRAGCARPTRCCRVRRATCCPTDRKRLDGIGRLLEYPPRSATQVEEDYLGTTRRARRVFEKLFYG